MSSKQIKHNQLIRNKYNSNNNEQTFDDDEFFDFNENHNNEIIPTNHPKKHKSKIPIIILSIIIIIILTILSYFLIIPRIYIKDELIEINYNEKYKDEGFSAHSYIKDYTSKIKIKGHVDTTKIGIYKLKYTLKFGLFTIEKDRKVLVSDNVKPTITLTGKDKVSICPNISYMEEGFQAIDEYDGDITTKVTVEKNNNIIKYSVCDTSFNCSEINREIISEDKEPPKIELKGNNEVVIYKGNKYEEDGYTASDNCDGDITTKVKISGSVNTDKVGTYQLKYTVSDNYSNTSTITRKIKVIERKYYTNTGTGIIYLTFDDGPSNLSTEILNILKEENIKATFFVTGAIDNYPNILKREYNEGHTIALHTYSHNYAYLYSNKNNFWQDIDKLNNSLERIIGQKSMIMRFPGGSSNTVSRNYTKGIMSELANEAIYKGYNYFDWNVDSNDAGSDIRNSNKIYENVINNLNHNRNNVVLFHDALGHDATVNALRNIIKYGKSNGYTFQKLDINTNPIRHGINN